MANQKYTTDQIIVKLREIDHLCAQGRTIQSAVQSSGIRMETYYRWREKYGWMTTDDADRLRRLEEENLRLKQLVEMWSSLLGNPKAAYKPHSLGEGKQAT